jgi:hypothetical protein
MIFKQKIGSRAQVMHGTAKMTGGGLQKKDLKYNKHGKIVSKKLSAIAKKENRLQKAGWTTIEGQFGAMQIGGATGIPPYSYLEKGKLLYRGNNYQEGVTLRGQPTFFTKDNSIASKYGEFIGIFSLKQKVKLLLLSNDTILSVNNILKQAEQEGSEMEKKYAYLLKNLLRVFFGMADDFTKLYNSIKTLIYILTYIVHKTYHTNLENTMQQFINNHHEILDNSIKDMSQYYGGRYSNINLPGNFLSSLISLIKQLKHNRTINPSRYSIRDFDHLIVTILIKLNKNNDTKYLKFDGFEYIQSEHYNRRLYNLRNGTNVPDEICIFFPVNVLKYLGFSTVKRSLNTGNRNNGRTKRLRQ